MNVLGSYYIDMYVKQFPSPAIDIWMALTWQAYYILDEILIAGELQESSKKTVARLISAQVGHTLKQDGH